MDSVLRILVGLVLVAVAVLAFLQWQTASQIEALATEVSALRDLKSAAPIVLSAPLPSARPKRKSKKAKAKTGEGKKERRHRRRERIEARADKLRTEFSSFAADHDLDDAVGAEVLEELQFAREAVAAVRADMQAGVVVGKAGRAEIKELRADTDAALIQLIGEDVHAELRGSMAEWLGRDE